MILYCDTIALVKLYVVEEGSSLVRGLVAEAQAGAARWAEAEGTPADRLAEHFEWPRDRNFWRLYLAQA